IRIYSTTPCSGWRSRVDEICAWLKDHERQVDAFAVLDDSDLSGGGLLEGHVVYTDPAVGLTADKVAAALVAFRQGPPAPVVARWEEQTAKRIPKDSKQGKAL
ncbi:tycC, partial [Symbiodinium necroappetens]